MAISPLDSSCRDHVSPTPAEQNLDPTLAISPLTSYWLKAAGLLNTCVIPQYNPAKMPPARPCGLDALYLYLGPTRFSESFEKLRRQHPDFGRPREDYRSFGLPFILHRPDHPKWRKLQFIGVGGMDRETIVKTLLKVTDDDVMALRVYRVDLVADLIGGPSIDRFRESVRVRNKRNTVQYWNPNRTGDEHEVQRREYGPCETLYFGSPKSDDFVRIYDKAVQLKATQPEAEVPGQWVRFERSFSKKSVPAELRTLGSLLQNGATFDPFPAIEINPVYDVTPERIYEWNGPLNKRMNAAWALTMIRQHGIAEAKRIFRREGKNPADVFDLLQRILSNIAVSMPTTTDLTAAYQRNLSAQLFGLHASLDALFEPEEQLAVSL